MSQEVLELLQEVLARLETPRDLQLLTLRQAAQQLQVSEARLRKLIREGQLACANLGGSARPLYRIRVKELEEWITQQETSCRSPRKELKSRHHQPRPG